MKRTLSVLILVVILSAFAAVAYASGWGTAASFILSFKDEKREIKVSSYLSSMGRPLPVYGRFAIAPEGEEIKVQLFPENASGPNDFIFC